ncbi:MAG: Na+/H+ antiporter NhaC family protein [Clostridia bacterium]|nr:Na+/H+ antiporter NhaC family protein [Clostridia bacterium]
MLNQSKKLNGKVITLIVACVVILALLIVAVVTGGVNKSLDCPDCADTLTQVDCPFCEEDTASSCTHCSGTEKIDCPAGWELCGDCSGTGVIDGEICTTCLEGDKLGHGFFVRCSSCGSGTSVTGSFWALLPPIIAIGLALITKEVFSSLFIGILSGSILIADWNPLLTVDGVVSTGIINAVAGTAGIFFFLVELGILVALVNKAGGSKAFGEWAKTHVKSKVGAALATFMLGVLIFIDDYFNCLTVGSVMRPVTDKHKISRSKLAFIIDATAAPICMIAPISSWAAAVSQYAADGRGLNLFIAAIPFNFYSILTLVFVVSIILMKFDFGPMRKHELNAENGDLFSGTRVKEQEEIPCEKGRVLDLILPIVFLLIFSVFALVYVGGIFNGKNFIDAFANTDATVALPWGGLLALVATIIYMAIRKVVSFGDSMKAIPKGFIAMVPAILILTFATALKNVTSELGAAYFVGDLMNGAAKGLQSFLPAIIFIVACILAFATGTSWGTFGILIPIVTAMFTPDNPIMIVSMSACLAGAVCGDHCSPISDTTIMSSAGAECEHLNHVSTQLPYSIFVAVISFVCYIIAGFLPYWYVMVPVSVAIMIGSLFAMKYFINRKSVKTKE